jgi:hypothetical protein
MFRTLAVLHGQIPYIQMSSKTNRLGEGHGFTSAGDSEEQKKSTDFLSSFLTFSCVLLSGPGVEISEISWGCRIINVVTVLTSDQ